MEVCLFRDKENNGLPIKIGQEEQNTFNCKSHIEITQTISFSCIPLSCLPHLNIEENYDYKV